MTAAKPKKSETTRRRVLDAALALFRARGFDRATMREIAAASGLSLGAAYYYFPSKEAIVLGWYERLQDEHEAAARAAFASSESVRERLSSLMHGKLDLMRGERRLLGALFGAVADRSDPLSVFGPGTRRIRRRSVALFSAALDGGGPASRKDPRLRAAVGGALWMLHLAFLLRFALDTSAGQKRTRRLVDATLELVAPLLGLAGAPGVRKQLLALVRLVAD